MNSSNRFLFFKQIISMTLCAMIFAPLHADEQGRRIMEQNNALKKAATVYNESTMIIVNGPIKEMKQFTVVNKKTGEQTRGRLTFTKPTQMEIISWSQPGKQTKQWLKLGAGPFQEIAASDMSAPFLGSHFYNEDLADQYIDDYEFTYLEEDTVAETPCFKIEARKKAGLKVYEKKILYLRKTDNFVIQIDFYEKKGHTKTLTLDKIEVIDGIITARKITMSRKGGAGKTLVYLKQIEYNKPVSDKLLTP